MNRPGYNKLYNAAERRNVNVVYNHLKAIYKYYIDVIQFQSAESALAQVERVSRSDWEELLVKIYTKESLSFYDWQNAEFKRMSGKKDFILPELATGFFSEVWKQTILRAIGGAATQVKISTLRNTTINDLRKVLGFIVEQRVGSREGARVLQKQLGIVKNRARTIARTETTYAASFGTTEAANSSTLPLEGVWLATSDARVRNSHISLNNTRKPKGEYFQVGASQMLYPCDPNGAAKESVNCRCSIAYVVDESRLN